MLGPDTGLTEYSGHPVVGTFGFPLLVYPGLKLNFLRLRFVRRLQQFRPDVVHIMHDGRIVKTGGPELALEVEQNGYADILSEAVDG